MFMTRTERMLSDTDKLNIFGNREYLKRYRGHNSFKWNPEDERLQFAWITVRRGRLSLMKGSIYAMVIISENALGKKEIKK